MTTTISMTTRVYYLNGGEDHLSIFTRMTHLDTRMRSSKISWSRKTAVSLITFPVTHPSFSMPPSRPMYRLLPPAHQLPPSHPPSSQPPRRPRRSPPFPSSQNIPQHHHHRWPVSWVIQKLSYHPVEHGHPRLPQPQGGAQ